MANEIRYNISISLKNGYLSDTYATSGLQMDQTNQGLFRNVVSVPVGSIGTVLDQGNVINKGWTVFSNLDTTNFVQIGIQYTGPGMIPSLFYPVLKLLAGQQSGPVYLGTSSKMWVAKADTAPVNLFYIVYEI